MSEPIAAVILAAGAGTRLKSRLPKVLHPVCGLTMVEHVLNRCEELNAEKIIVVAGHGADMVRPVTEERAEVVLQNPPRGTGHALLQTKPLLKNFRGSVVVLCGDAPLIETESLKKLIHLRQQTASPASVLTFELSDPKGYGRIVRNAEGHCSQIVEELNASTDQQLIREVNSGVYCFDAANLFSSLEQLKPDPIKDEIYLTDVIDVMSSSGPIQAYLSDLPEQMLGVNSRKDLMTVNRIRNRKNIEALLDSGVTVLDENTVFIGENVKVGADTVIHPNTVIDGDCEIGAGCEIGPFAHIRKGVRLGDDVIVGNFVEVTRSTIGKGSRIKHLSYIGDTVAKENVNIGAGTITANYDGKEKHQTVIEEGAMIGSGTVLIAPTSVGKNAKTGAGSVVVKGNGVPENSTAVGIPAKMKKDA